MAASIAKAQELRDSIPGSVILQQFENPANAAVHERTTGEEIWRDTDGEVAVFVAGVGTGGTVCGVARALKKYPPTDLLLPLTHVLHESLHHLARLLLHPPPKHHKASG